MPVEPVTDDNINGKVDFKDFKKPKSKKTLAEKAIVQRPPEIPDDSAVSDGTTALGSSDNASHNHSDDGAPEEHSTREYTKNSDNDTAFSLESLLVHEDKSSLEFEQPETFTLDQVYRDIFSGDLRETTKQLLLHSEEGQSILNEIKQESNNYSDWETSCLNQIRQAVQHYKGKLHLEIKITAEPTQIVVEFLK